MEHPDRLLGDRAGPADRAPRPQILQNGRAPRAPVDGAVLEGPEAHGVDDGADELTCMESLAQRQDPAGVVAGRTGLRALELTQELSAFGAHLLESDPKLLERWTAF